MPEAALLWNLEGAVDSTRVERSDGDNLNFTQVANLPGAQQEYKEILPDGLYFYRIRSRDGSGFSQYSNEAQVTLVTPVVGPDSPTDLKLSAQAVGDPVTWSTEDYWDQVATQEGYAGVIPQFSLWDAYGNDYDTAHENRTAGDDATPGNPAFPILRMHASGGGGDLFWSFAGSWNGTFNYAWISTNDAEYYGNREGWHPAGGDTAQGVANYCGERMAAVLDSVQDKVGARYDWDNGIALYGVSMGGWGSWVQCMVLPERWREKIVIVDTQLAHTYSRAIGSYTYPGALNSNIFEDSLAPPSDPYWDNLDFLLKAPTDLLLQNMIFWNISGCRDNLGTLDPRVIKAMQDNRMSHIMTWDGEGRHGLPISGSPLRNIPKNWATKSKPFVAFTNSTGDWPYTDWTGVTTENMNVNGHVNLGFYWDWDNITEDASAVTIPIRYEQQTGFPETPAIPDMPVSVSVDVSLRRTQLAPNTSYAWSYDVQSGNSTTDVNGVLTATITMVNSGSFTNFVVTK